MKSTTKKFLLGILLTVCLTVLLALCAGAEDVTYSEGLEFTSNGDGTCCVSGIGTCSDTEINIPPVSPEGDMVTKIGTNAFRDCYDLTSVIIPEGVMSVESFAFYLCTNLQNILIPESVAKIGDYTFTGCYHLTSLVIPAGVTYIGIFTEDYTGMSTGISQFVVSADNPVYHSDGNCLIHTESKTLLQAFNDFVIPSDGSVEHIAYAAFAGKAIGEIVIPDGVKSIGSYAFAHCSGLTTVILPHGLEEIQDNTFAFCLDLNCVHVPVSVKSISSSAFKYCDTIWYDDSDVYYHGTEAQWNQIDISENNILLNATIHFLGDAKVISKTEATCTEAGEITYECGCGSTHTSSLPTLGHLWEGAKWYTFTSPTCMTAGEERIDCQRDGCDYYDPKPIEIDSSAHSLEWTHNDNQHWQYCTNKNKEGVQCTHTAGKANHDLAWDHDDDGHWQYCKTEVEDGVQCAYKSVKVAHDLAWDHDDDGHWQYCKTEDESGVQCTYKTQKAAHDLAWDHDDDGHWQYCKTEDENGVQCKHTTQKADHKRGADGFCTICGTIVYSKGLEFTSNGDGTCYVSGIGTCTDRVVHIPPVSPDGDAVTGIGADAFCFCFDLTSITIPKGVTSIGDGAFTYCLNLTSITIPEGVRSIGAYAFSECYGLMSITIPEGVISIGSGAFYRCGLSSITIPEGVMSISSVTFYGCSLTSIDIPNSVKSIGTEAFSNCSLTSITIPEGVRSIGAYAFSECYDLTSVTILEGVSCIGELAFSECYGLTSITIPNSVTSIGVSPFYNCIELTSITVAEGNAVYHSANNCLIETASKTLIAGCHTSVIPDDGSVTSIGTYAFYGCERLTSITIPEGVTSIEAWAFADCVFLESITLPESLISIGNSAFKSCRNVTSITLPENLTSIGDFAFSYWTFLEEIYFNATAMNDLSVYGAFTSAGQGGAGIKVLIGKNVTCIPAYMFYSYSVGYESSNMIVSVEFEEGSVCESIGQFAFDKCTCLKSITLPDSVTSIGNFAFRDCKSLTNITVPESLTSIGSNAFYYCNALTDVYYKDTEEKWNNISIEKNNDPLLNATIHFMGDWETVIDAPTCTEDGCTYEKCSCGEKHNVRDIVPATDHSYTKYAYDSVNHWFICEKCGDKPEDAVEEPHKFRWTVTDSTNEDEDKLSCTLRYQCACGYGSEEPIITGTAKITGASLALGDTLTLRYYATLPAANMNVVMRFTYEGETYDVNGIKDAESGEYVFAFDRIPPSKMDAVVKAELVLIQNDTEIVLAVKDEYSISEYCKDAKEANPEDDALNLLLDDLAAYNKAAEDYENGVSADLSDSAWTPLTDSDFALSDPASESVRFISAGVRFGYVNRLFFKFKTDDSDSVTVTIDGKPYGKESFSLVEGTENTYIIYTDGIYATEFDKVFDVRLVVNGEDVQKLEYSVNSYVESKQDDPEIGALVRALFKYGKASELYRNQL